MARTTMTVHDLHREAIAMKVQGLDPGKIADRVVELALDNGHIDVRWSGAGGGGTPDRFSIIFRTGEVIYFDGTDWHYRKDTPPP